MGFYLKNQNYIGTVGGNRFDNLPLIGSNGSLYSFTTFTFTSGGIVSGRLGPSLATLLSNYNTVENDWLNDTLFFNSTDSIQLWTVPASGTYKIVAYGAQGGFAGQTGSGSGGFGAKIEGDFDLEAGSKLRIVVGQVGGTSTGQSGGGGGGSFVLKETGFTESDILIIAGGGGGGQRTNNGGAGNSTTSATPGATFPVPFIGEGGNNSGATGGAGGAGFSSDGASGQGGANSGGKSPANGFYGGVAGTCTASGAGVNDVGGFGGGGGGEWCSQGAGGGGGGYTGGNGSNATPAGGGAGSYNNGANQINTAGFNSNQGKVEITLL